MDGDQTHDAIRGDLLTWLGSESADQRTLAEKRLEATRADTFVETSISWSGSRLIPKPKSFWRKSER